MRQSIYGGAAALIIIATATQCDSQARNTATADGGSASVATAAAGETSTDPIATLNRMAAFLHSLKAFQVHAVTTRDDVLEDGQLVQNNGTVDELVRPPDRLRVEINTNKQQRTFLYDGKNFTMYAERMGYYATVPAPPTIAQLADQLQDNYDIEMPLRDLFSWGTPKSKVHDISSATDLGPAPIEGVTCEHYALRQPGLDWQVWIQLGEYPLPRKIVITTTSDDARPQYSEVLTWNLAPSFNEAAFQFVPPPGASKIVLARADSSHGAKE